MATVGVQETFSAIAISADATYKIVRDVFCSMWQICCFSLAEIDYNAQYVCNIATHSMYHALVSI